MRIKKRVISCKQAEMNSDASDRKVRGEEFLGNNIKWENVFKVPLRLGESEKNSTFRELWDI